MSGIKTFFCKNKHNINLLRNGYSISIFDKIKDAEEDWLQIVPFNLFFSPDYLKVIEDFPPTGITPYYVILYFQGKPTGIFYFQYKHIKLAESLRFNKSDSGFLSRTIKAALASLINMPTLICGNTLLTGAYGFHFKEDTDRKLHSELLQTVVEHVSDYLETKGLKKGLVLLKDVKENVGTSFHGYTKFEVQPEMTMYVENQWKTMDDYLEAMKSKYRVRARRAFKKAASVRMVELEVEDIDKYETEIHKLYQNISDEAGFNLFILHSQYFKALKDVFGSKMKFIACFCNDVLIGFYTAVFNYGHLDAHFLGYDYDANRDFQLYLNMLYGLIKEGIEGKCDKVVLSRTALEIKSSVGAVPEKLYLYLKHHSPLINNTVPPLLSLLIPTVKWKQRLPFRTGHESNEE